MIQFSGAKVRELPEPIHKEWLLSLRKVHEDFTKFLTGNIVNGILEWAGKEENGQKDFDTLNVGGAFGTGTSGATAAAAAPEVAKAPAAAAVKTTAPAPVKKAPPAKKEPSRVVLGGGKMVQFHDYAKETIEVAASEVNIGTIF